MGTWEMRPTYRVWIMGAWLWNHTWSLAPSSLAYFIFSFCFSVSMKLAAFLPHHDISVWESADHGLKYLKLWAKINIYFLFCFYLLLGHSDEKLTYTKGIHTYTSFSPSRQVWPHLCLGEVTYEWLSDLFPLFKAGMS